MSSPNPKSSFFMSMSGKKRKSVGSYVSKSSANGEKSTKKSALDVKHEDDDNSGEVKKELVTSIGDGRVMTASPERVRGPRVIKITPNRWRKNAAAMPKQNCSSGACGGPSAVGASSPGGAQLEASTAAYGTTCPTIQPTPSTATIDTGEKSLDQLALEAFAHESQDDGANNRRDRYGLGLDSKRVIDMASDKAGGADRRDERRVTTLLAQSAIPGLADIDGEDAKFRHDLEYRAEDLGVRSQAYAQVPVNEFGAALLRGMGWEGPAADNTVDGAAGARDVVPRHQRLGLGAQPKPPEIRKQRKRRPGEKLNALEDDAREIWQQKASEEKKLTKHSCQFSVMDIVEISSGSSSGNKKRAMILKTQGVPGLNKVSVRLEHTGEKVDLDKSLLKKIHEDEQARYPFSESKNDRSTVDMDGGRKRRRVAEGDKEKSRKRSHSRSRSRGRDDGNSIMKKSKRSKKEKHKIKKRHKQDMRRDSRSTAKYSSASGDRSNARRDAAEDDTRRGTYDQSHSRNDGHQVSSFSSRHGYDGDFARNRDRESNGSVNHRGTSTVSSGSDGGHSHGDSGVADAVEPPWLRPHIRVRIIHKGYASGRAYLGKGRVVDVPRCREATVRMDSGGLVLEGVKQRHLETVLPSRGGKVVVIRGNEKGVTGKLLARDKDEATALVQVYDDLRAITLSFDDVAEFTGMLDEDVDD